MIRVNKSFHCELCDAVLLHGTSDPESVKWDWFTGYLSRAHYYCPAHVASKEATSKFMESRCPPEGPKP